MSNHLNVYSQKGCIGCKPCDGGSANVGRGAVFWTIAIFTGALGLLMLPFFKRCQFCGHNAFMNKRETPSQQYGTVPNLA